MFDARDRRWMSERGIDEADVLHQIALFKKGAPTLTIDRPCRPGDGIVVIPESQVMTLAQAYARQAGEHRITKFVPASGAASRMFKSLQAWLADASNSPSEIDDVRRFVKNIERFAFFDDLRAHLAQSGKDITELLAQERFAEIIECVVSADGLNLSGTPKGLLPFHHGADGGRTPVEEHLVEAAQYGRGKNDICHVHFTVSPEHRADFEALCSHLVPRYEKEFACTFDVSFSVQNPKTDTIAVDPQNRPFRHEDGTLEFRPGGHGALIDNLDALDGDLIFIKNIDNCVPDRLKPPTILWKKVLAGLLLQKQRACFQCVERLSSEGADDSAVEEARRFASGSLSIELDEAFSRMPLADRSRELLRLLDRPMRVCGTVPNEGEPGGGPFWVRQSDGRSTRQIVESAQIDHEDPEQQRVVAQATHFNPVDLVCGVRNFRGEKFDLKRFVDPDAVFISHKSKHGKPLKALERPGLWNGAMSDWITLFVEVPMVTFNPVKTVLDLLRSQHQCP